MDHNDCVSQFSRGHVTDQMLCASSRSDRLSQSDSGGPLVIRSPDGSYSLAGVLSMGMGREIYDDIGVFTNIAAVRDWMADYMII